MKKDGDLARVLSEHLGADDSVLARTLAGYLGQQSPVFKLLSPTEAQGIRAQLEETLNEALAEQRRQVLQEFSLDSKESALSRLVQEMQEIQEQLKSDFSGQADKIRNEFSLDKPDSALYRLVSKVDAAQKAISDQFSSDNEASVMNRFSKLLASTSAIIDKNLTLDDEQSALSRLKREIRGAIDGLVQRNERSTLKFVKHWLDWIADVKKPPDPLATEPHSKINCEAYWPLNHKSSATFTKPPEAERG